MKITSEEDILDVIGEDYTDKATHVFILNKSKSNKKKTHTDICKKCGKVMTLFKDEGFYICKNCGYSYDIKL